MVLKGQGAVWIQRKQEMFASETFYIEITGQSLCRGTGQPSQWLLLLLPPMVVGSPSLHVRFPSKQKNGQTRRKAHLKDTAAV